MPKKTKKIPKKKVQKEAKQSKKEVKQPKIVEIVPEIVEDKEQFGILKIAALIVILVVIAIAAYVILVPYHTFVPGQEVDKETFLGLFAEEDNIIIFMDARGVSDAKTRQNIFQCGIDFAGSSGMGPKNATYFSIGDDESGCVTPQGVQEEEYCFDQLDDAITIYVQHGDHTGYFNNGVIVEVNSEYPVGLCGINVLK